MESTGIGQPQNRCICSVVMDRNDPFLIYYETKIQQKSKFVNIIDLNRSSLEQIITNIVEFYVCDKPTISKAKQQ